MMQIYYKKSQIKYIKILIFRFTEERNMKFAQISPITLRKICSFFVPTRIEKTLTGHFWTFHCYCKKSYKNFSKSSSTEKTFLDILARNVQNGLFGRNVHFLFLGTSLAVLKNSHNAL